MKVVAGFIFPAVRLQGIDIRQKKLSSLFTAAGNTNLNV
jgi:hypothetical protein